MRRSPSVFYALLLVLALLGAGAWLLRDFPDAAPGGPLPELSLPDEIGRWQGRDNPLSHHEIEILAPARIVSRTYYPARRPGTAVEEPVVWMNVIRSRAIGKLHNFYDSLVASGAGPRIMGTHVVDTARGPLRATLIRCENTRGKPYYLLLWYQWDGGSAPDRWQWYRQALQLRLQRKTTVWYVMEAATPVTAFDGPPGKSPDLRRLDDFIRAFQDSFTPSG